MPGPVSIYSDLKTAAVLSGAFAIIAAVAVPFMLEIIPADAQKELPLPVPIFALILAIQSWVVYGLLGWAGLRLARQRELEPAPLLTFFWTGQWPARIWLRLGLAFGAGLLCGLALVVFVAVIHRSAPETLPQRLHPPSIRSALIVSAAASLGEEILFRLFLLSAFVRMLSQSRSNTILAVLGSAILFGLAHAPAMAFLFGGLQSVPSLAWMWLILLNGLVGVVCGFSFLKIGFGGAALAHFGTDLIWHVASQLGGS
ncbi:MAG TPA: CPBP family intramembrane glutamic endopeptidase [Gemmataceae bacterium]|nr:CPBP family intramembrane glutamic endopeptidase [Gemmataceae bacterium]